MSNEIEQPSSDGLCKQVAVELNLRQKTATADKVLSEIVRDLHHAPIGWSRVDVDDRNAMIASWRSKIILELREYF